LKVQYFSPYISEIHTVGMLFVYNTDILPHRLSLKKGAKENMISSGIIGVLAFTTVNGHRGRAYFSSSPGVDVHLE
jgi:hypothetical protein